MLAHFPHFFQPKGSLPGNYTYYITDHGSWKSKYFGAAQNLCINQHYVY